MDKNLKIGITGLGLIGGSIFKALCALKCDVVACTRSKSTVLKAQKYCKNVSTDLEILKDCDLVFVCTPMNKTLEILDVLETILKSSAIVTDVCSLKEFVCAKERPYVFIPSHPMAGTEFSGFDKSFESLFQGAKWAVTPDEKTDKNDVKKLIDVIQVLGAQEIICSPKEHDEAVAMISHMPMLLAQALYKTAEDNPLALKLASSGFRDMTRLALSNEEMANDMISMNSSNIQHSILKLYTSVGQLISSNYAEQISEIKKSREKMYQDGKNVL